MSTQDIYVGTCILGFIAIVEFMMILSLWKIIGLDQKRTRQDTDRLEAWQAKTNEELGRLRKQVFNLTADRVWLLASIEGIQNRLDDPVPPLVLSLQPETRDALVDLLGRMDTAALARRETPDLDHGPDIVPMTERFPS